MKGESMTEVIFKSVYNKHPYFIPPKKKRSKPKPYCGPKATLETAARMTPETLEKLRAMRSSR